MALAVRRATVVDAEKVIAGLNQICGEGGAFYTPRFRPDERWRRLLYRPGTVSDHLLAVATWDGEFAGACRLFPGPAGSYIAHVAELGGMFVLPPFRRRGVGRALLDWSLQWASGEGIAKVTLQVFASNVAALALYRQAGFREEGRLRDQVRLPDQGNVDMIVMAHWLSP